MIDMNWNGLMESNLIAQNANYFEMNIAPHNYYSHFSTYMNAAYWQVHPNVRIMEVDVDDVPWKDELVDQTPEIHNGRLRFLTDLVGVLNLMKRLPKNMSGTLNNILIAGPGAIGSYLAAALSDCQTREYFLLRNKSISKTIKSKSSLNLCLLKYWLLEITAQD